MTRGAVRCSAWLGDVGCGMDSLISEGCCVLLPKRIAGWSAAKPETPVIGLVNLANHLGAIESGVECKEDVTRCVKPFKAVDNLKRRCRWPIVANEGSNLLDGFVVIGKRVEDKPVIPFECLCVGFHGACASRLTTSSSATLRVWRSSCPSRRCDTPEAFAAALG